jgi:FADH2 O2-dependent halogenase
LCSIGLQLDPRLYPQRDDLTPEQEFFEFIQQFPDLFAQLKDARAVRDWVRIDRLQYAAHHIVADRVALLAHAAGFIDPLYSKGLYATHASIFLLADLLIKSKQTGDYSAEAFAPLERMTLDYSKMADRLVASSFKSWHNFKLWNVYEVLWLLGAYLEYLRLITNRYRANGDREKYIDLMKSHRLAGGGFPLFFDIQEKIDALMDAVNPEDETDVDRTVAEIKTQLARFPWLSSAFKDLLDGKNHLPDNKLRLNLFNRQVGFMGSGEYREHFFGGKDITSLLKKAVADQMRYSIPALNWRRKTRARLSRQTPGK